MPIEVYKVYKVYAYRRPKKLEELTIRAKVPPLAPSRPKRKIPGMTSAIGALHALILNKERRPEPQPQTTQQR